MKSKDQIILEESYQKASTSDYIDDALVNPQNYTIEIFQMDSYDWDEWNPWNRVLLHPKNPKDHRDYQTVDNPEDAASLIDTFEEKNPEGISDKRNQ